MAETHAAKAEDQELSERGRLAEALEADRTRARTDPFTNPFLLFALATSRELTSGDRSLEQIEAVVGELTQQGFIARAERLGRYLGDSDPEALSARLSALFEGVAANADFEAFAAAVGAAPFGIVLTAHPTFSLTLELSRILVELATGRDAEGRPLSLDAQAERRDRAIRLRHGPPESLSLEVEHEWSVLALQNVHTALETVYASVLRVARAHWPERWTELTPRLVTLATWVGFDQDGRTDVSWQGNLAKRLSLKRIALAHRLALVDGLDATGTGAWRAAVQSLADLLGRAIATVDRQSDLLDTAKDSDAHAVEAFAAAMVRGRAAALVDAAPVMDRLDSALEAAPDDVARERLMVLRAGLATEGVSLARIHVRLNAGQLHNAIRPLVGLHSSPTDPANRRTYFTAIETLIETVEPVQINFGDLIAEPASAPRLMMTVAQMLKLVDASTPVRFLVAETETGFTLLTALYFARLFGVEDQIEISPLFETEEGFERGEQVIEEALRSPAYRAHLVRQGRLAIEFGFSDSGRFIGQMAATFRVERLRLRLLQLLEDQGLSGLEIIFFNTHGESIGRGGHPTSLSDRYRYAAPPRSRAEFAARGVRIREEDAFQGGEGYLPLLTAPAALATVCTALDSVLQPDAEAEDDPIYADAAFASEFFATVQQDFTRLAADPDYAALIGMFATHLLPKTGSRPVQRQAGDAGGVRKLKSVSELRAIPNNAVLQQLGYLANSVFGVGRAAEKDLVTFQTMREPSPRFRRALAMAQAAYRLSDLHVLEAYCATMDPGLWLDRAEHDADRRGDLEVQEVVEAAGLAENLTRLLRRLKGEDLRLRVAFGSAGEDVERRNRLLLLHGLRIVLIQRLCQLAVKFPAFNPRGETTQAVLQARLMRLDVVEVLSRLTEIFPKGGSAAPQGEFAEPSTYAPKRVHAYLKEHETVFAPLEQIYGLILSISAAVNHEIGAFG